MKNFKIALILLILALLAACQNTTEEPANTPAAADSDRQPTVTVAEATDPPASSSEPTPDPTPTPLPEPTIAPTPQPPAEPEEVTIEGADGLTLFGTFYPGAGQGPWPAVMLLHMNGGQRSDWDAFAQQLASEGFAALTVDMRGHGETGGQSDWEQAADDLGRVWAYLTSREDVDETRAAVAGASIGANMSLVTGVEEPSVKTVIMLSPGLNYFGVTTDDRIVQYGDRPSLIVASEEDTLSADSSEELHQLAVGENELVMYQGAGHGTNMFAQEPELTELMISWLDRHVKGEDPMADLPAPTLLDVAWDDRSAFRQGLISSETAVLDELTGASVYHMDLDISPDLLSVAGLQEVRYTNQEDAALEEVYFHLYPNLLGGNLVVSGLTVNGEPTTPEYPDRAWSVMRVPLPAPLAPGEQVVIGLEFAVDVPTEGGNNYGVFATIDDVLALAHFYPQIAVYDDEGWNIAPPPPNADVTYADTAFYLVRVTAPAEQVMVASGNEIDRQTAGDDQIVTIAAGPVRDFYIASSDRYTLVSDRVGETTVNSYGFPEFAEQNEQVLEVATTALDSLGARLGEYPFVEFDVAPTPNLALGVEYPGAVVIRSALYDPEATLGQTPALFYTEATVAHEVGHQWFYSVVGNDQLDEPWLDEALTQYVTFLYFLDTYGPQGGDGFRDSLIGRWERVDRADIPIGLPAGEYDSAEYGAIVYGRGPLFFEALSEEMGQEKFEAFLRDYYQQNKWGISTGQKLKALAEVHCDCDLSAIFAEWVGDL